MSDGLEAIAVGMVCIAIAICCSSVAGCHARERESFHNANVEIKRIEMGVKK